MSSLQNLACLTPICNLFKESFTYANLETFPSQKQMEEKAAEAARQNAERLEKQRLERAK